MPSGYRLLEAGDSALTVELSRDADPATTALVRRLDAALAAARARGIREIVPTYRSLQIVFDPLAVTVEELAELVERAYRACADAAEEAAPARRLSVPVCFGGEHGVDFEPVAERLRLAPGDLVRALAAAPLVVAMIGFQPGFAYLGGLPEILHLSRRETPRLAIPPGSVSIGGVQAAISSVAAPSAWHLLGRTPLPAFDLSRPDPFLFRPGDRITLRPVDGKAFAAIARRVASAGADLIEEMRDEG